MARVRLTIHGRVRARHNAWVASLPGSDADKQNLLEQVYLPDLAARALKLRKTAANGVWIQGPGTTRFFVQLVTANRRVTEIMILDLQAPQVP